MTATTSPYEQRSAGPSHDGLDELTIDEWQQFVAAQPAATPFHHRNWLQLMSDQYGMVARIFAIRRGAAILAGLPFLETTSLGGRKSLTCLPFTDLASVLTTAAADRREFCEALAARDFGEYRRVRIRTDDGDRDGVPLGLVVHTLDTTRPISQLRTAYASSIRRNIRRARQNGLMFNVSQSLASVEEFYELHVKTRRKLGIPVQPRSYFRRLYGLLVAPGLGGVAKVSRDGQLVSGVLFLSYQQTLIYKYAASEPTRLELRPNDLLVDGLIEYASRSGHRRLEFGTSRLEEQGLRRFKSKWGATERPLFAACLRGPHPKLAEDSFLMSLARAVVRRSPAIVCRGLGEVFYKYTA